MTVVSDIVGPPSAKASAPDRWKVRSDAISHWFLCFSVVPTHDEHGRVRIHAYAPGRESSRSGGWHRGSQLEFPSTRTRALSLKAKICQLNSVLSESDHTNEKSVVS